MLSDRRSAAAIWLVRHGDTDWSDEGRHTGRAELPLNLRGREAALRLRQLLAGCDFFARVLCSPQERARETCELAGFGTSAQTRGELVEWDYGEFEGLTDQQSHARRPGWSLFADGAPGGESVAEVLARVDRLLDECRSAGGPVILFGHGKTQRLLAARALGQPPLLATHLPCDPASLSILEADTIALWNWAG
ncbi:MAG: histidine phosphatase family protein [Solirubrobacteraceae bacterium]